MSAFQRAVLALLILALLAPLGACGKKNSPEPPKDEPSTYPRSYPKPGS